MTITPPPAPAPTPPPTPPPTPDPPAPEKSFSQDDVNRLIAAEKRRLLAEQPDLTELRTKAAKLDELEAANKTELEKAQGKVVEAERKAAESADRAKRALLKAAVVNAAHKANAIDPDAVFALIDQSKMTVSDDGTVDGIDDALKALLAEKTFLVGKPTTPPVGGNADGGARGAPVQGQLTVDDIKRLYREGKHEEVEKARQEGRLTQAMGA